MQPSSERLYAEILAAVTGLYPKPPLDKATGLAAASYLQEFEAEIEAWVDSTRTLKFQAVRVRDADKTYEKLKLGLDPANEGAALVQLLNAPEVASAYMETIANGRSYLLQRWPRLEIDTPWGPKQLEPSTSSVLHASVLYAVVDSPERLVKQLRSGTLTADEVTAVQTVFPVLHEQMLAIVRKVVWSRKEIARHVEAGLRTFLGMPASSPVEVPPPPDVKGPAIPNVKWETRRTALQRLESR